MSEETAVKVIPSIVGGLMVAYIYYDGNPDMSFAQSFGYFIYLLLWFGLTAVASIMGVFIFYAVVRKLKGATDESTTINN